MKDIIKWALAAFLILVVYSYAVQQHLLPSLSVIFAQPAGAGMPVASIAPAAQVAPAPTERSSVARIVQPRATQTPASPTAEATTAAPVPTDAPRPVQPTQAPTERSSEPVIPTAQPLPTAAEPPPTEAPAPAAEPAKPVVADARTLGVPTPAPVANAGESDVQPVPQPQANGPAGARTQYTANLVDGENNGLVATYTYQVCPIAGKLDNGVTCELAGEHGVVGTMGGRCNAYWQDGDPGAQTLILTHAPLCTPA